MGHNDKNWSLSLSSLISFFEDKFHSEIGQWEKSLLQELKITEVGSKATKKMMIGGEWPTLSLNANTEVQLSSSEPWKKASNTFAFLEEENLVAILKEELQSGVKDFFFHTEALNESKWKKIESTLVAQDHVRVFILDGEYKSDKVAVVSNLISGKMAHDEGGHTVQELALLAKNLIEQLHQTDDFYLGVYVDSAFFHNIAKLRAARLIANKILEESQKSSRIKIVALTSYRGWTLYERYSNMLRNETAVAASYIGGADHIQSAGYNTLFELESDSSLEKDHFERSLRMSRNTTHILGLESMLGIVEDAAYGSYHLENLTQTLCEEAWTVMQSLLQGHDLTPELKKVREQRLEMAKTRKLIMSGMNDYPDVKETLSISLKPSRFFRVARVFEELRLSMERSPMKPVVCITYLGDYGALNARMNFVKNYFELLGLKVVENSDLNLKNRSEEIIVLCALDDQYPLMEEAAAGIKTPYKYIAGKYSMPGLKNLFAGQNVYDVLHEIAQAFKGKV